MPLVNPASSSSDSGASAAAGGAQAERAPKAKTCRLELKVLGLRFRVFVGLLGSG